MEKGSRWEEQIYVRKKVLILYQKRVSILGPMGYEATKLPLRHSDLLLRVGNNKIYFFTLDEENVVFQNFSTGESYLVFQ